MNPALKRLLVIWLVAMICGYMVCTAIALRSFPEGDVHEAFRMGWILDQAGVSFVRLFLPLHCTAILLSYSLFHPRRRQSMEGGEPFYRMVSGALILFLILTAGYTVLREGFEPAMHLRQQTRLFNTQVAVQALEQAREAVDSGEYGEAETNLVKYLTVLPEDQSARDMLREVQAFTATIDRTREPGSSSNEVSQTESQKTAVEYLELAERLEGTDDLFTAHYYARLAYQIDPMLEDAKRLAVRIWDQVEQGIPDPADSEQAALYRRKMEGYSALTEEDEPIRAYYIFAELHSQNPLDSDVEEYLRKSMEAVRTLAFFMDEVEAVSAYPGNTDILFMNRRTGDLREFVYFKKVVETRGGVYFFGIETIAIDPSGVIQYHFRAPYGKMLDQDILMACLDRYDQDRYYSPEYLAGDRPDNMETVLSLSPPVRELGLLNVRQEYLVTAGIPELWSSMEALEMYGFRREPVEAEVLVRIIESFTFLVLSLFAVAAGWGLRVRLGRLPVYGIVCIPAILGFVLFITEAYKFIARVFSIASVRAAGFWPSVVLMILVQGGLILAALVILSVQTTSLPQSAGDE